MFIFYSTFFYSASSTLLLRFHLTSDKFILNLFILINPLHIGYC